MSKTELRRTDAGPTGGAGFPLRRGAGPHPSGAGTEAPPHPDPALILGL